MIDPIVDEVRKYRMEHARKFNFDLHAIGADVRRLEATCGHEVVELPPKRIAQDGSGSETPSRTQDSIRVGG